jgi:hypothetical protein
MNSVKNTLLRISCLAFLLLPNLGRSQDIGSQNIDSLMNQQDSSKIKVTGIYISGGVNFTQYNSDSLFFYLFNKTGSATPAFIDAAHYWDSGRTIPIKMNSTKPSVGPIISLGLELNTKRAKKIKMYHLIDISYMRVSGQYSYSAYYREEQGGSPTGWAYVNDSVQSNYVQTTLCLGYKFQPTYKFLFLSFGINCFINLIKVDEQKKEQRDEWDVSEATGKATLSSSTVNMNSIISDVDFINFPIQLGVGAHLQMKKILLEPAFYFTPCFLRMYNIYNASVRIIYNLS